MTFGEVSSLSHGFNGRATHLSFYRNPKEGAGNTKDFIWQQYFKLLNIIKLKLFSSYLRVSLEKKITSGRLLSSV